MRLWGLLFILLLLAACGGGEEVVVPTQIPQTPDNPTPDNRLQIGGAVQGGITPDDRQDIWILPGQQGRQIFMQITRLSGNVQLQMQLLSPDNALVFQIMAGGSGSATSIPLLLPQNGDYQVVVSGGSGTGDYQAVIGEAVETALNSTQNGATATTPSPSPAVTASLTPTLTPSDVPPTIDASPTASATVSPTMEAVSMAAVSTEAAAPMEAPPITATVTIPPPGGRLDIGASRQGEMTQPGETHRYTFIGGANQTVGILVNPDPENPGTLNPYLELQAPNGQIIGQNDDWLPTLPDALVTATLPASGVYTVFIRSNDRQGAGRYYVSLSEGFTLRDVERGEAAHNAPNEQRLETYGSRDVWTVTLQAGETFSVAVEVVERESDFDVMAEVVAPDGSVLGFDDNSGADRDAFLNALQAPIDGTYVIHIAARNNATIGAYRLWWQRLDELPTAAPTLAASPTPLPTPVAQGTIPTPGTGGETIRAGIGQGRTYNHVFAGETGQEVSIVVLGGDGFDPVLRVLDPNGVLLLEVDDVGESLDPRTTFTITVSGLYTIEVSGYEGMSGNFTLSYLVQ